MINSAMDGIPNFFEQHRKTDVTSTPEDRIQQCFDNFDQNGDGFLDREEFTSLLLELFRRGDRPYPLEEKLIDEILKLLDTDQDGMLSRTEFKECWHHWLNRILNPVSALVIVDVQNDFISGTLSIKDCPAGQDGEEVVPVINRCLDECKFDVVVYTADWHPEDHISFVENVHRHKIHHSSQITADKAKKLDTVTFEGPTGFPKMDQILWPAHCIQKTWGAELHKNLKIVPNAVYVNKGMNSGVDSYSAFWDNHKISQTKLLAELTKRGVTDVYVCGLAYDVCVAFTSRDALEHGFRTVLIDDASRGVSQKGIRDIQGDFERLGGVIVQSAQIPDMISAKDRMPKLGLSAAHSSALEVQLSQENARK